jgi:hypothetical protein
MPALRTILTGPPRYYRSPNSLPRAWPPYGPAPAPRGRHSRRYCLQMIRPFGDDDRRPPGLKRGQHVVEDQRVAVLVGGECAVDVLDRNRRRVRLGSGGDAIGRAEIYASGQNENSAAGDSVRRRTAASQAAGARPKPSGGFQKPRPLTPQRRPASQWHRQRPRARRDSARHTSPLRLGRRR